jgi:hypothetical protein
MSIQMELNEVFTSKEKERVFSPSFSTFQRTKEKINISIL